MFAEAKVADMDRVGSLLLEWQLCRSVHCCLQIALVSLLCETKTPFEVKQQCRVLG